MPKLNKIFSSWRVWVLLFFIAMAVVAIGPKYDVQGALIKSVEENSSASINGVTSGEIILSFAGKDIISLDDFYAAVNDVEAGDIVKLTTSVDTYSFVATDVDGTVNVGISVVEVPTSNLRKGLDLAGGVRVLLAPEKELDETQLQDLIIITTRRLNVYGLSDINVRSTKDLEGNQYLLVEIAGVTREQVRDLLSGQGKFEAKIGEETVFVGGEDIKKVCRSADCSGVYSCNEGSSGWVCRFRFAVDVSPEAARKHAEVTEDLAIETVSGESYLEKQLDLYLDDILVDSLYISSDLQGRDVTQFSIQGSGVGGSREEAINTASLNMRHLQTILITGSLPVKLSVAKLDSVSPTLGEEFFTTALMAMFLAILAVSLVVFIRYRTFKIAIPVLAIGLSEILLILGVASLIRWNLDLAAIAGILAAVGTGVDDQIVITDEVLSGESKDSSWKERIARAFFIIFAAYFTTVVAMAPLWMMGAGLLKGFAITTTIGVTLGVFITRPAYAAVVEILLKE